MDDYRRTPLKGCCRFMVSDAVSRVVGKRCCERKVFKDGLCKFHQPESVKARYNAVMERHRALGD